MPNGIDKAWYRMCAAIDGFRTRYGQWPQRVRTPPNAIPPLFTAESLAKIEAHLELIEDGAPFIAEDDEGGSYNYAEKGQPIEPPDIRARDWLGVQPDSQMVREYNGAPPDIQSPPPKRNWMASCSTVALSVLLLVVLANLAFWVYAALTYNGNCIGFEVPGTCSFGQYMGQAIPFTFVALPVLALTYWWVTVPLLILFPLLGLRIASRLGRDR